VVPVLALVDKFVLGIYRTDWHRTCRSYSGFKSSGGSEI